MKEDLNIYLPGGDAQFVHLAEHISVGEKDVLLIGSNNERIAQKFLEYNAASITIIVDDYDSLMISRILLKDKKHIQVRLMEYDSTDFKDFKFELVYAQGSISNGKRNKILKEIKRILKPNGIISIGEVTLLKRDLPEYVKDIYESSDIIPLPADEVISFYEEKKFNITSISDLSRNLKEFYLSSRIILDKNINSLPDNEKSYYKKILNKISHESNAYLNLGADKYMGFTSIILKKQE